MAPSRKAACLGNTLPCKVRVPVLQYVHLVKSWKEGKKTQLCTADRSAGRVCRSSGAVVKVPGAAPSTARLVASFRELQRSEICQNTSVRKQCQ